MNNDYEYCEWDDFDLIPVSDLEVMHTEDGEPLWTSRSGDETPLSEMEDSHLLYAHRLVKSSEAGWRLKWLPILFQEIRLRGLEPLPKKIKTYSGRKIRRF